MRIHDFGVIVMSSVWTVPGYACVGYSLEVILLIKGLDPISSAFAISLPLVALTLKFRTLLSAVRSFN